MNIDQAMNIDQILSNLNVAMEIARDEAMQANQSYRDAKSRFTALELFKNEILAASDIGVINSEGGWNSCSILTRYYKIDGRVVLFTVMEVLDCEGEISHVGQIIDYSEKTVLFACQFSLSWNEKQELFDCLLANYIQWRFEL